MCESWTIIYVKNCGGHTERREPDPNPHGLGRNAASCAQDVLVASRAYSSNSPSTHAMLVQILYGWNAFPVGWSSAQIGSIDTVDCCLGLGAGVCITTI